MNFPGGPPGRNLDNMSLIFDCFFVVNHQATGVTHKNGEIHIICPTRLKIVHTYKKGFFKNFACFLQKNKTVRILMLCIIFVIFTKRVNFFRGGYVGKLRLVFTNFNLVFCCLTLIIRGNNQKW